MWLTPILPLEFEIKLNKDFAIPRRAFSLGWPRRTYAHKPGATAVTNWLGIAFSADWLLEKGAQK